MREIMNRIGFRARAFPSFPQKGLSRVKNNRSTSCGHLGGRRHTVTELNLELYFGVFFNNLATVKSAAARKSVQ